jgi:hypothetical protein
VASTFDAGAPALARAREGAAADAAVLVVLALAVFPATGDAVEALFAGAALAAAAFGAVFGAGALTALPVLLDPDAEADDAAAVFGGAAFLDAAAAPCCGDFF